MRGIIDFVLNNFLTNPTMLIGVLVALGYTFSKKSKTKIITGTFSAMVGIQMLLFGGGQFSSTFKPIANAVSEVHGINGYLMDPYAMKAFTQGALGDRFGYVAYIFVLAFVVNLVMVMFGKYTKVKGIFLTGHTGIAHSQAVFWLVLAWFGTGNIISIIITGILVGLYWSYSTTLAIKPMQEITDNAGFTIGHNQTLGIWFFSKIAGFFGDPEDSAEHLELPGWLAIFNDNVTSVAIIMAVFTGGFLLSIGINNVQEMAGNIHWLMYIIELGINFSMYMVILLTGVRMMVGELSESFQGIQDKLIPNAVPAVDVAAILPYAPTSATLGFITTTLGTLLAMGILLLIDSPIMVIPGFVPLFFAGGPIGVVANKYGGYKAVIVSGILLGLIHSFGTVWMIPLLRAEEAIGWTGMFDWATFWPAVTEVFKLIARIFSLGPFA